VTTLEQVFRDQWGRVLAALIGFLGDFDLAEEAAQEAFAIAAERWPRDGVPASPGAWLVTTARNRAINRIRRDRTLAAKTRLLQVPQAAEDTMDATTFPDERLELIFTCCHPALSVDAQVALTLRTLGGLTTAEIARAFLVPEPTMAQRLVRAKRKIKAAQILGGREAEHLPEQEYRPLPCGQVLQAGDEREPQALAHGNDGRGVSGVRGDQRVRNRLQPGHIGSGRPGQGVGVAGRTAQAGRQRPPAALLKRRQAGIGGDAVEPGTQRRPALEGAVGPPGPQIGLLHQIFGLVGRAEHPVAVRQQLMPEPLGVLDELA
jgi:RNA polymerase sigma factor (sigma-70 family)